MNKGKSDEIKECITDTIRRKLEAYNPETRSMPFHCRLLGRNRMALYSFIHSINTVLGTSIFEQAGVIIARGNFDYVEHQYKITGHLSDKAAVAIDTLIDDLRSGRRTPDKKAETKEIIKASGMGEQRNPRKATIDLFLHRDNTDYMFDIKTAKPNIAGFKSIKQNMLEWLAIRYDETKNSRLKSLVAIPYNPYEPRPYERWTLQGIFDMQSEFLVGADFWDFLGGKGTYENLLGIFEQAGLEVYDEIDEKMNSFK